MRAVRQLLASPIAAQSMKGLLGRGLGAGLGLAMAVLLPRLFPLEIVGQIYLVLSVAVLISVPMRFGLDYQLLTIALKHPESQMAVAKDFGQILSLILLIAAVLIMPLIYVLRSYLAEFYQQSFLADHILAAGAWGAALAISYTQYQAHKALGQTFRAAVTRQGLLTATVLLAATILATAQRGPVPFLLELLGMTALLAASLNAGLFLRRRTAILQGSVVSHGVSLLWAGLLYMPFTIAQIILSEVDFWLVARSFDASDIAIYATAKRLMLVLAIMIDLANLVLPRHFAQQMGAGRPGSAGRLIRQGALLFLIVSITVTVLFFLIGQPIVSILFEQRPNDIFALLLIFFAAQAAALVVGFGEIALLYEGRDRSKLSLLGGAVAAIIVQATVSLMLRDQFGLSAMAFGFMAGLFTYRTAVAIAARRVAHVNTLAGWK